MTKLQLPERYKTVERNHLTAPPLPTDRPPTKREAWDHYSHIYGSVKTPDELRIFVKEAWAWKYAAAWLLGWRKQPDWVEGAPVLDDAVPHLITPATWQRAVNEAWARAQERQAA